jgi:uncharacterized Zn-finger protein
MKIISFFSFAFVALTIISMEKNQNAGYHLPLPVISLIIDENTASEKEDTNQEPIVVTQDDKPFICLWPECSEAFKRKNSFDEHLRFHTGEDIYKCTYQECQKTCANKAGLASHMRAHINSFKVTKYEPYKCEMHDCKRSFAKLTSCKRHQLICHKKK